MELIDIYDEHMKPIGQAPRETAHAQGLWHKTFQCWIIHRVEGQTFFLFQRRSPQKDVFPNLLDKSCGGHLTAGETIADGVRELEEELGLAAKFEDLTPCGIIAVETQVTDQILDREFCHVFLYEASGSLEDYELQAEEVSGIYFVAVQDYFALGRGEVDAVQATGWEVRRGEKMKQSIQVGAADFTPVSKEYLSLLENGLRKICKF